MEIIFKVKKIVRIDLKRNPVYSENKSYLRTGSFDIYTKPEGHVENGVIYVPDDTTFIKMYVEFDPEAEVEHVEFYPKGKSRIGEKRALQRKDGTHRHYVEFEDLDLLEGHHEKFYLLVNINNNCIGLDPQMKVEQRNTHKDSFKNGLEVR